MGFFNVINKIFHRTFAMSLCFLQLGLQITDVFFTSDQMFFFMSIHDQTSLEHDRWALFREINQIP